MAKVNWTDSAIDDLNDIGEFIAKDSEKYAQITVNKLFDYTDILEIYPLSGKSVPEFEDDSIRELVKGNYRIVYQIINDNRIDILTVHNCARLIENAYDFSDFENE